MKIEEIPSDISVKMSKQFHDSFNAAGCDPMCHCCNKMLAIGSIFKLATVRKATPPYNNGSLNKDMVDFIKSKKKKIIVRGQFEIDESKLFAESKEVMLCDECTVELYEDKEKKKILKYNTMGGCFRINGKIVH